MELKKYQKKSKKTIKQVANELDIPFSTYNNYLIGTREPNLETLCKLAKYFNCSLDDLVGIKKENSELTEHTRLIEKINELSEIECHKLNVFADGLISNRPEEQKEKTYTIIREIENEELNEMYNQLDFGEQNQVLGYIKEKIKLKNKNKDKK